MVVPTNLGKDKNKSWLEALGITGPSTPQAATTENVPAVQPSSKVSRPKSKVKYTTATNTGIQSKGFKFGGKYDPYTGGKVPKGFKIGSAGVGGRFLVPSTSAPGDTPKSKKATPPTAAVPLPKSRPTVKAEALITSSGATAGRVGLSQRDAGYTTSRSYNRNPTVGNSSSRKKAKSGIHDTKGLSWFRSKRDD